MNQNPMLSEVDETKFVVKVNGRVVSDTFASRMLAEQAVANLPKDQQPIAEIVPVTSGGQEILLG